MSLQAPIIRGRTRQCVIHGLLPSVVFSRPFRHRTSRIWTRHFTNSRFWGACAVQQDTSTVTSTLSGQLSGHSIRSLYTVTLSQSHRFSFECVVLLCRSCLTPSQARTGEEYKLGLKQHNIPRQTRKRNAHPLPHPHCTPTTQKAAAVVVAMMALIDHLWFFVSHGALL